jgi:hypothetical protein
MTYGGNLKLQVTYRLVCAINPWVFIENVDSKYYQ